MGTPRTWVTGETVTRTLFADWNAQMAAAGDHTDWSTYAPTLAGGAVGTGGVAAGRVLRVGQLAYYTFSLTFDTLANGGKIDGWSSACKMNLPWAASTASGPVAAGPAFAYNAGSDDTAVMTALVAASSQVRFRVTDTVVSTTFGGSWGFGTNFTASAGSVLAGTLIYRTDT